MMNMISRTVSMILTVCQRLGIGCWTFQANPIFFLNCMVNNKCSWYESAIPCVCLYIYFSCMQYAIKITCDVCRNLKKGFKMICLLNNLVKKLKSETF